MLKDSIFPPPKVLTTKYFQDHGIRNGVEYVESIILNESGFRFGQKYESNDTSRKPFFPRIKTTEQAYGLVNELMNLEAELDIKYKDGTGVSPGELIKINREFRDSMTNFVLKNSDIRYRPFFPQIQSVEQAGRYANELMKEQREINQKYIGELGASPEEVAQIEQESLDELTRFILENSDIRDK